MSLIVTFPTREGIVLAAGGQIKVGQVDQKVPLIHRLTENVCWAATGEFALIQKIEESSMGMP